MKCDHILLPDATGFRCSECHGWFPTRMADWTSPPLYGGLATEIWNEQKAYDAECEAKKRHADSMKAAANKDGGLGKVYEEQLAAPAGEDIR